MRQLRRQSRIEEIPVPSKAVVVTEKVVANYQQSGSKVVAQPIAEVVANYQQSGSKVVARTSLSQLSGLQRNLLRILYHSCRDCGQKHTQPLSIQHLQDCLQTSSGTVKNAIHRLIHKGIIIKYESKNGRGGWTQYKIENSSYTEMLQFESDSKVVANYQQSSSKVVAQPIAQPIAGLSSSNSSIIKNTNTTSDH